MSIKLSNISTTTNSVTFSIISSPSELHSFWSYSLNGGTHVTIHSGSTYAVTHTITGLSENTTYSLVGRAYKGGLAYFTGTSSFTTKKSQTPPTITASVTGIGPTSFTINGSANVTCKNWEYQINAGAWQTLSTSSSATSVSKQITGLAEDTTYTVRVRATRTYNGVTGTSGTVSATTTKSQAAPVITASASNVKKDGFTLTLSANVTCKNWEYQINAGAWQIAHWGELKSLPIPITGLTPATEYTVKGRATRVYNDITGTSPAVTVTTVGPATLNSVNTLTADNPTASLTFNWTKSSDPSFTYTLRIKDGATTVVTVTGLTGPNGSKTITFTSAQRTALLARMPNKVSFAGTFELETLDGATRVGNLSSKTALVRTTEANSAPEMAGFTHSEENAKVSAVTANYVQSLSDITVVCDTATALNGASISKYGTKIGSQVVEGPSKTINFGTPTQCGTNYLIEAYVEDSRGYRTTLTDNKTIGCYAKPDVLEWATRRKDSVGEQTALMVVGSIRTIGSNGLKAAQIRIKPFDGAWGAWETLAGMADIGETRPGRRGYKYEDEAWKNLDPKKTFTVQIRYQDLFEEWSNTVSFTVARGIPLMSLRDGGVGINQPNPQAALDVVDEENKGILINGKLLRDDLQEIAGGVNEMKVYKDAAFGGASVSIPLGIGQACFLTVCIGSNLTGNHGFYIATKYSGSTNYFFLAAIRSISTVDVTFDGANVKLSRISNSFTYRAIVI